MPHAPAPAPASPFASGWRDAVLRPLAERAAAGTDPDHLRRELLEHLWPWAQRLAELEARKLPAGADRDETRSQLLSAVWQATRHLDWDRWQTWPALLLRRVRGARIDAARVDDAVSRRDRLVLNRIDAEVATAERTQHRTLSAFERDEVRRRVLGEISVRRRNALLAAPTGPAVGVDLAAGLRDHRWDPEATVVEADRARQVAHWVRHDLPEPLQAQITDWLATARTGAPLPERLRAQLLPFIASLVRRVEDDPPSAPR